MSTFLGVVEEFPGISVDRFDGDNLKSTVYFLSHCHCDHMNGLKDSFFSKLDEKQQFIYCTSLSKAFLEGKFKLTELQSSKIIKIVDICSPIIVDYFNPKGDKESIVVLCAPAGHCPGSVMFIFENEKKSVLYTGDFRMSINDLKKIKPLHNVISSKMLPKKFNKIYLDTTFLDKNYPNFPSRDQSLMEISRAAKNWISRDSKNVVILECSALYGSEFIYIEFMNSLKIRVHVKPWVYQNYSRIPELERCITSDAESTPIHACMQKRQRENLKCRPEVKDENILTIVPSAMRWKGRDLSKNFYEWDSLIPRRFYVCLSMHSSYNELKDFIDYFDPPSIYGCVESIDRTICIQDTLNELMKKNDKTVTKYNTYDLESLKLTNFKRARVESKYFSDDSSD